MRNSAIDCILITISKSQRYMYECAKAEGHGSNRRRRLDGTAASVTGGSRCRTAHAQPSLGVVACHGMASNAHITIINR